ncbi:MAG: peptide-methionine (R)-S-oxide reductase MsrB [Saprospiraceae bacterium]|nr:peptide-methionine (R)-S-oxide reductase MsrB [Pyrinomonadaceae bacterium]
MRFGITTTFTVLTVTALLIAIGCAGSAASQNENAAAAAQSTPVPAATKNASMTAGETSTAAVSDELFDGKKIVKTDADWRKQLSPEQYYVLREEGTERPYTGELNDNKEVGDYHCAACKLKLFSSKTKYDSETGWPSFYQPINKKNVTEKPEKAGDDRIEVECARCGSHLGHVFDDGPEPTGLRYCMNSLALKFEKAK